MLNLRIDWLLFGILGIGSLILEQGPHWLALGP